MDLRLKFNEDEFNYDKYRPTYPEELFLDIINYSYISIEHKALEIGIGTGQATLPILQSGCNVTAIELGNNLTFFEIDMKNAIDEVGGKISIYDTVDLYLAKKK